MELKDDDRIAAVTAKKRNAKQQKQKTDECFHNIQRFSDETTGCVRIAQLTFTCACGTVHCFQPTHPINGLALHEQEDGQAAHSSVVRKLQVDSEILLLQKCNRGLQCILVLSQYPHLLALNLCLHFQF